MHWDPPHASTLIVDRFQGRLELRGVDDAPGTGVCVDLSRVSRRGMRQTPLGRALGEAKTAIDATAGLCADAYLLALMGCRVTAIERSPLLAALVRDGLERARADPRIEQEALARLQFMEGDARTLLPTLPRPDAVLLDPMFPQKRKASALPRKEIRLVGAAAAMAADAQAGAPGAADPDAQRLFSAALACAAQRVLVKRADDSPPLVPRPAPDAQYMGRTSRIDMYVAARQVRRTI